MKIKNKSRFHPSQIEFVYYHGCAEGLELGEVWINIPSEPQDYFVSALFANKKSHIDFNPYSIWSEDKEFESSLNCSSDLENVREFLEKKLAVVDYLIEHSEQIISSLKKGRVSVPLED